MKQLFLAGVLVAAVCFAAAPVNAMFGAGDQDYSKFCEVKSPRQTIILVDDRLMIAGQTRWAESMMNILLGSLMPSEPITVVKLKAETGSSEQVWTGCFPDYSAAEKVKLDKETSILSKSWRKVLETQQATFRRDLGAALGKVYVDSQRAAGAVSIDAGTPPQKQLIRALKDATTRFDRNRGHIRAILYSDMLENSDLGNSLKTGAVDGLKMVRTVGLNFQQAVLYVFGVGSTFASSGNYADKLGVFWENVLDAGVSHVAGFGSDLAIPTGIPVGAAKYEFTIKIGDDTRKGMMLVFYDRDGRMVDSLAVAGATLRSLVSDGTYVCSSDGNCRMEAKLPRGLVTTNEANDPALMETLVLNGSREKLKGTIGVTDAKLKSGGKAEFEINAKIVQ